MNRNPGFTKIKSDDAINQNLDLPSPLATALTERRKKMASKRMASNPDPELDSLGNPTPDENPDD